MQRVPPLGLSPRLILVFACRYTKEVVFRGAPAFHFEKARRTQRVIRAAFKALAEDEEQRNLQAAASSGPSRPTPFLSRLGLC